MNSYETVNSILVKMFKDILDIEERALITSEYKDISVNGSNRYSGAQKHVYRCKSGLCYDRDFDDRDQPSGQEGICRANEK